MALTPEQIKDEASHYGFIGNTDKLIEFVRAIEATCNPEDVRKNADRYLVLREMHWSNSPMAVVTEPRTSIKPGYVCPSKELLDETLDAIIKERSHG